MRLISTVRGPWLRTCLSAEAPGDRFVLQIALSTRTLARVDPLNIFRSKRGGVLTNSGDSNRYSNHK